MAFFGVTVETVESICPHPDPEVLRLEIAKCENMSFQFVVPKGLYSKGSKVLYFPLDSILPQDLIEKLGMTGKFSGPDKNIVKTLRLRGQISQGFVASTELLPENMLSASSEVVTAYFGVTKFVPDPVELKDAIGAGLPSGFSAYDIEGADRNQDVVDLLLDQDVCVMEKMEGENSSYGKVMDDVFVSCRERSLIEKPGSENAYWVAARENKLLEIMKTYPGDAAMLYGELCGPGHQGNYYKLKEKRVFLFDIRAGDWLDFPSFQKFLAEAGAENLIVPIIFQGKLRDFLGGRSIQEASNGQSLIAPDLLREGIVVKPLREQSHPKLGRLIIKQRSPLYLAKTGR